MSHYYASCQGGRGQATRAGHKSTGIHATANSWSIGAEICIEWNSKLQTDIVTIYKTAGSNKTRSRLLSYANIDGQFTIIDTTYPELLI